MMKPTQVLETCLYAPDLVQAQDFYSRVIGLEIISNQDGRHVFFRCGSGVLLIFNPEVTSKEETKVNGQKIPLHGARGAGHLAFSVNDSELDQWRNRLTENKVTIESEVHWPNGGKSIYFRDPAGNSLEFATPLIWESKMDLSSATLRP